jgi:hypothetical protein
MAAILDQAWLQGKVEKSEPKILFCVPVKCSGVQHPLEENSGIPYLSYEYYLLY